MKLLRLLPLTALLAMTSFAASTIRDIPLKDIDGKDTSIKSYDGKVVLVVNVASRCGNTPQYATLEKLYRKYKDQGLVILGFPCNDFGAQEPGTAEEIKTFCSTKYDVSFPLMAKLHVKGEEQHPLYAALTGKEAKFPGDIDWNFAKFLIGKNGEVLQRFKARTAPDLNDVATAIEGALKAK